MQGCCKKVEEVSQIVGPSGTLGYRVVSQNKGPQYRSQNNTILILGTFSRGTPNFGKAPYVESIGRLQRSREHFEKFTGFFQ